MPARLNPIGVEVVTLIPDSDDMSANTDKEIKKLIDKVQRTDRDMIGWLQRQEKLTRLRLGIRNGRRGPWKGSSNVSVPLTDGLIRRWRPALAALILDPDVVAFFKAQEPGDIEAARLAEQVCTFLFRVEMDNTNDVIELITNIAWRGHAYVRTGWEYRTEREARVVLVDHLFPQGLEAGIQALQQAEAQETGEVPDPHDLVVELLLEEYELDEQRDEEMLMAAADAILQGAPAVKLVYRKVLHDRPAWQALDPINVIVPQDQDPETAEFFTVIHYKDEDEIRCMARDGVLLPNRTAEFLEKAKSSKSESHDTESGNGMRDVIRNTMNRRANADSSTNDSSDMGRMILWEIYARMDVNGDGEREKVILWYAPKEKMVLGLLDFVFPHEAWPITYFPFEACRRPIDNRGIADLVKTFQQLANSFHNARIDAAQIMLAPVLQYRALGGQDFAKSIEWRPGALIPVQQIGDLAPIPQDLRILSALLQEEQAQQRLAETYVGVFDATLTQMGSSSERRTATEVSAIQSLSGSIFGLDAKIFQESFKRSLTKLWQVFLDLGPQEMFVRVTGEELPMAVRKSEISRNFDIQPSGTPANTNKVMQLNILQQAMQVIMSNPLLIQSGRFDFAKIVERWLQLIDYNLSREIVRPAEEGALVQQLMQGVAATGQEPAPL